MNEIVWTRAPEIDGEIRMEYWQQYSHALTFRFLSDCINDEDEWEIEADVKWDGCINWTTNPEASFHFCDVNSIRQLERAFVRAWNITAEVLPTADRKLIERSTTPPKE